MYSGGGYRYGFNGQEKEPELGDYYAFEYRIHDARLGRFLSVDPIGGNYPWQSVYAYFKNCPILIIDFLGLGEEPKNESKEDPKWWTAGINSVGYKVNMLIFKMNLSKAEREIMRNIELSEVSSARSKRIDEFLSSLNNKYFNKMWYYSEGNSGTTGQHSYTTISSIWAYNIDKEIKVSGEIVTQEEEKGLDFLCIYGEPKAPIKFFNNTGENARIILHAENLLSTPVNEAIVSVKLFNQDNVEVNGGLNPILIKPEMLPFKSNIFICPPNQMMLVEIENLGDVSPTARLSQIILKSVKDQDTKIIRVFSTSMISTSKKREWVRNQKTYMNQ
jgi:RHS repeat-associated protein